MAAARCSWSAAIIALFFFALLLQRISFAGLGASTYQFATSYATLDAGTAFKDAEAAVAEAYRRWEELDDRA